jgi:carbon-monoxide dehydrogenase small subunit
VIEINQKLVIPASIDRVWAEIGDVPSVVSCIPGAELTLAHPDGSYDGILGVAFGPMHVKFEGNVRVDLNSDDHTGEITASAKDRRGAARLKASATIALTPGPDPLATELSLVGQMHISGRMAAQIEGGATLMTSALSAQFLERITDRVVVARPGRVGWVQRVAAWFRRLFARGGE